MLPQVSQDESEETFDREAVMKAINDSGLLSYDVRTVRINNYLNSLYSLARLLTQSGKYADATDDVIEEIVKMIREYVTGLRRDGKYDEMAHHIMEFEMKSQVFDAFGETVKDDNILYHLMSTTDTDIDRQFRRAENKLGNEGVGNKYGRYFYNPDDPNEFKIDVILYAADDNCMARLMSYAERMFHKMNDDYRRKIIGLEERFIKQYNTIVSDGDIVSKHNFRLPETITQPREINGRNYTDHLLVDDSGTAKINLNNWEEGVLEEEQSQTDFVCWLRNPPKKSIVNQEGYVPPDEYNADFESASLKPEDYSDIGQAKVLVREYGNELKYTSATDFLRFDGECWREDKQMAIGAVEEFLDLQLQDAMDEVARVEKALEDAGVPKESIQAGPKELLKEVDGKLIPLVYMLMGAQTYLKFVQKRRDYKYIVSAANTAKPMIAISVSDLDKNENLINTPYATYDLRKGLAGELPHNPEDLITKITACSPGEDGKQIWLDALNLFFCKDQKLIDYVQETVGMAAIGKVYQEHMIIAYGGGANGKSTFWNTIFRVLGNYAGKLSAEALTMNCKRNVKPEMAELKGKRLIISSEMEEGMRLNTAVVKQLCSTDEIQAEKKYKDPFSFVPSHTLVLYTNHLPKVGANDDGIWRRLVVIPFNAKITGKSDIKNYADYLFEHAGPAIMSWIIEGAKRAIDKNFHTTLPDVVEAAVQAYREDNDWLGQFLEECCEMDPSYKEKSGELYQAYRAHCMQNGEYIRSTTDFYSSMDKAGYNRIRKNTGVQVVGLKLKEGQDFLE